MSLTRRLVLSFFSTQLSSTQLNFICFVLENCFVFRSPTTKSGLKLLSPSGCRRFVMNVCGVWRRHWRSRKMYVPMSYILFRHNCQNSLSNSLWQPCPKLLISFYYVSAIHGPRPFIYFSSTPVLLFHFRPQTRLFHEFFPLYMGPMFVWYQHMGAELFSDFLYSSIFPSYLSVH